MDLGVLLNNFMGVAPRVLFYYDFGDLGECGISQRMKNSECGRGGGGGVFPFPFPFRLRIRCSSFVVIFLFSPPASAIPRAPARRCIHTRTLALSIWPALVSTRRSSSAARFDVAGDGVAFGEHLAGRSALRRGGVGGFQMRPAWLSYWPRDNSICPSRRLAVALRGAWASAACNGRPPGRGRSEASAAACPG